MEAILAVTKSCRHCSLLEKELKEMKILYEVRYVDEHPELLREYGIRRSPNILVDGEMVFRGMPAMSDLRAYFKNKA